MSRIFPFPLAVRVLLVLLVGASAGWHLDRWRDERFEPVRSSYEYESDDPEIMVLAALSLGVLPTEARKKPITPLPDAAGWSTIDGISLAPPAVELVGEESGYNGTRWMRGHVLRLPEPRSYGQAIAAMQRLARTGNCPFAIDDPYVPMIGPGAPEIPVMQIVWTRNLPGEEPRHCQ